MHQLAKTTKIQLCVIICGKGINKYGHCTHVFLPRDHAIQEGMQRVFEVLNSLLLETRNFRLDQLRAMVELLF
jgi:hypothetical protein